MNKNIIYGLVDPRNDLVYYVGKTTVGAKRPLQHLYDSHSGEVNDWVKELQSNWINVRIDVLEEVEDLNRLPEREDVWIKYWHNLNPDLFNKHLTIGLDYTMYTPEDDRLFHALNNTCFKFGEILAKRRKAAKLTQQKLSELTGLSRSTISLLERNEVVTTETIQKVVREIEGHRIRGAALIGERSAKK